MIVRKEIVSPFQENCYIVGCPKTMEGIIIDPGDEAERLLAAIADSKITIKAIVNTHAHLDHVGAVEPIKKELGVPFHLHADDEDMLKMLPQQALMFGLTPPEVPKVDAYLEDGGEVSFGEIVLKVIHTPGHSRGGVTVVSEKAAFVGDCLFAGSIGRTDLYGGSYEVLISTIREKLFTLPGEVVVYSGHGENTTIGHEKQFNPFFHQF